MAHTVLLDVRIQADKLDELLAILEAALPDTRAFDGCKRITTYQYQDDPTHIMVHEEWESRAHQEKYVAWRTETGMMDVLASFVAAPPVFHHLTLMDM